MKRKLALCALTIAMAPWAVAAPAIVQTSQQQTDGDVDITGGPTVSGVTGNSAVIGWTTSAQSSAVIHYGTDKNNLAETAEEQWGGPYHKVTLSNLQPNTTYYYQVTSGSAQGSGAGTISRVESFKTTASGSVATTSGDSAAASTGANKFDITAGPTVNQVTANTADIGWTTNAQSSAVIKFGTDKNNLSQTAEESWGGPNHHVVVRNLQPGTTYYYQVVSANAKGTGADDSSPIGTFTTSGTAMASTSATTAGSNGTVRVLAGPVAQAITDKSATIWWMSNTDAPSTLKFGASKNQLTQTATVSGTKEHRADLTGLTPSQTYYFEIAGNGGPIDGQFQTADANFSQEASRLRISKGPVVEYLTGDQAVVAWSTNRNASTIVRYGTDPNNLTQTAQAPWGSDTHRVSIRNLKPNTKYYFVVESSQAQGTGAMAKSEPAPFQTFNVGEQAMTTKEQH